MFFFASPEERKRERARREERLTKAVPWDPTMKWAPELTIQAATYKPYNVFEDCTPTTCINPNGCKPEETRISASGEWLYCVKKLPRGTVLDTYYGNRRGNVMFDGEVLIPALHTKGYGDAWLCERRLLRNP